MVRAPRPCDRWQAPRPTIALLALALAGLVAVPACHPGGRERQPTAASGLVPVGASCRALLDRAEAACRDARRAEKRGTDDCVDGYYAAAVYAYAALTADSAGCGSGDLRCGARARNLHNASLGRCLRAATAFGRVDPRSHLTVNTPIGPQTIPIAHRGFVWAPADFHGLIDPDDIEPDENQHRRHRREGLGAPQVVRYTNPQQTPADRFQRPKNAFAATAVLRPDLAAWLGGPGGSPGAGDTLELVDPLRVRQVAGPGGRPVPVAADLDAPIAEMASQINAKDFTWQGFLFPSRNIDGAALYLAEPFQPGKPVVVMIHGLLDNPFIFADMITELREQPGFVDRFQLATFRYPTGGNFLRTGAVLRRQLRECAATLDPAGTDPGVQNMVLLGYSMGGLLTRLQVISSGDAIRSLVSSRPIDQLVAEDRIRQILHELTEFEPVPTVKRAIYLGAPHGGSALATQALGRFANSLVRRDPAEVQSIEQVRADNPGVINPEFRRQPSSVDMLARKSPLLAVMAGLPVNPAVTQHTILGTGPVGPESLLARGDTIVPIDSASIDGTVSELRVRSIHTKLYYNEQVIAEVARILDEHAALLPGAAVAR